MIKIIDYTGLVKDVVPTVFPDTTKLLKVNVGIGPGDYTIVWLYDNDEELFQVIAITKHLQAKGFEVNLRMPYIPNARMDRVKSANEVFTLKYFAHVINWLGFKNVYVANPHSTVSEALFERLTVDFDCVTEDVVNILYGNGGATRFAADVIYFPDEGACKRYSELLSFLNLPFAFGIKKRDWKTGKIMGLDVVCDVDLKGKNVLMVDDICSRGTTFVKSAEKLKELGAGQIALYVTHCENTINDGEVLKNNGLIDIVYTTNSIFRGVESDKLKVIRKF